MTSEDIGYCLGLFVFILLVLGILYLAIRSTRKKKDK